MFLYRIRDYHIDTWYKISNDGATFLFSSVNAKSPKLYWFTKTKDEIIQQMDLDSCGNRATELWTKLGKTKLKDSFFDYSVDFNENPGNEIKKVIKARKAGLGKNDPRNKWLKVTENGIAFKVSQLKERISWDNVVMNNRSLLTVPQQAAPKESLGNI